MTITQKSEKLPIGTQVDLMIICEKCPNPKLEINGIGMYEGNALRNKIISITCENKLICKRLVAMYEGMRDDGERISEQNTNV